MNKPGMTAMPTEYEPLAGTVDAAQLHRGVGPRIPGHLRRVRLHGVGRTGRFRGSDPQACRRLSRPSQIPTPPKRFYDRQVADWNGCKNSHIKFEYQGASTEADLGVPATTAGILTMKLNPTTSATTGQQCERNMAVRANVIVDVRACSPTVGSSGLSITSAIAEKIK